MTLEGDWGWRSFCAVVLLGGCGAMLAAAPGEAVSVETLTSAFQCGVESSQPQIEWVDDAQRLAAILERSVGARDVPAVDFEVDGVLVVSMGQRPSAGYALVLIDHAARVAEDVLQVHVERVVPARGRMAAQVVTKPCLLLRVPAVPFNRIRIVDRDGEVWASGNRPHREE